MNSFNSTAISNGKTLLWLVVVVSSLGSVYETYVLLSRVVAHHTDFALRFIAFPVVQAIAAALALVWLRRTPAKGAFLGAGILGYAAVRIAVNAILEWDGPWENLSIRNITTTLTFVTVVGIMWVAVRLALAPRHSSDDEGNRR